jgi:hypothetical protein
LAKVRDHLAQTDREVRLLSTAVDQNLGFTGNSYRAANWGLLCKVRPRPYLYLDKDYKTIRQIQEIFGEKRWEDIESDVDTFDISKVPLLESLIFIAAVRKDKVNIEKVAQLLREGL